ncbi:MAG: preprotein translocase subunit YajC [Verrucomicrobiales bacterium]
MQNLIILAQQEPNPMGSTLVMIGLMLVMMYFLIIRPQSKQRKELQARIDSMEKGDKVVTAGGIHASVHHISEKTVTLKLSEGVFVPFEKSSVMRVEKKNSKGGEKAEKSSEKPASDPA